MEIQKKYIVYELNKVLGSDNHLALEKVKFKRWIQNEFDTEDEAIQALIDDGRTYEDYVVLRNVYIN